MTSLFNTIWFLILLLPLLLVIFLIFLFLRSRYRARAAVEKALTPEEKKERTKFGPALIIIAPLYFILALPLSSSVYLIAGSIGGQLGRLSLALVIRSVLSRFWKLNSSQKALHTFVIAFLLWFISSQPVLAPIGGIIFVATILVFLTQLVLGKHAL